MPITFLFKTTAKRTQTEHTNTVYYAKGNVNTDTLNAGDSRVMFRDDEKLFVCGTVVCGAAKVLLEF